jgi:hypothetical protein
VTGRERLAGCVVAVLAVGAAIRVAEAARAASAESRDRRLSAWRDSSDARLERTFVAWWPTFDLVRREVPEGALLMCWSGRPHPAMFALVDEFRVILSPRACVAGDGTQAAAWLARFPERADHTYLIDFHPTFERQLPMASASRGTLPPYPEPHAMWIRVAGIPDATLYQLIRK